MEKIIIYVNGKDRVGLISDITKEISDLNGNIETSKKIKLDQDFNMLILVSIDNQKIDSLDKNIGKQYSRIRIGIGRPKNNSTGADHVLDNFSNDEKESVEKVTNSIIEAFSILMKKDLDLFSSKVNLKQ